MSHIFEALQKSEAERSQNRQPSSMPAELLRAAEQLQDAPTFAPEQSESDLDLFPSLKVTPLPNSKLLSLTDTESLAAEKFRFFGVRLRQLQQQRAFKKVLITSTIPEEGKSMISANLAVILARKKKQRVLLLEGDLRRPVLPVRLGLGKVEGLSEWLQGDESPSIPNIYRLDGLNLWLLPAGRAPENPLEMMQSSSLSALMDQLSNWFDWILIDSPPVLPLADTSVWMRMADGIILVAREGVTEKRELKRGLEVLDPTKLLGVVLNSSTETDHSNYYQRYAPATGRAVKDSISMFE